jgi:metal-dependent HD superfamily phosphatase/phosphodiesterase
MSETEFGLQREEQDALRSTAVPGPASNVELAGWWVRVAAYLIDTVILFVGLGVLLLIGAAINDALLVVLLLVWILVTLLGYWTYFEGGESGQTPGKKAMGIRVRNEAGGPAGYGRAFGRNLVARSVSSTCCGPCGTRGSNACTTRPDRRSSFAHDALTLDPETEKRIEQPASDEAERETRLTPAEAVKQMRIRVPVRANKKLRTVIDRVNKDDQVKGWWHVANVNAVARMEINDHSWVHIQIVTNIALKLLRQLTKHHVEPAMVTDYGMTRDDAELVVALTALTHCIGMSVHRHGHEDFSLFLAEPKLRELLVGMYDEPDLTVVVSEVLQGIISHRADGEPLTLEAGILRVADALDMEQGRSRIAFERGRVGIHSLSAAAIEEVEITDGKVKPIRISIRMNNSSGIYQVDGLLKAKLRGSGLEPYVEVIAHIDTEAEKRLVPLYELEL